MKAIMLTIRLKWFYLTYKGIKTIEVRKSAPKDFVGNVFEVVSKTNFEKDLMEIPENEREFFKQFKGKVGLKFTLNKVERIIYDNNYYIPFCHTRDLTSQNLYDKSCLSYSEMNGYIKGKKGYAWHISNLVIFDKPRELSEFRYYAEKPNCQQCKLWQKYHEIDYCKIYPCNSIKLTKAPQSWQFIEVKE